MNSEILAGLNNFFSPQSLSSFFLKAFGIVFALVFLLYAVVTYKQTQEISRTVRNARNRMILAVSFLQIIFGLVLLAFAIFLI